MFLVVVVATMLAASVRAHANADVQMVKVQHLTNETFLFEVQIEHDDEPEHYCDGWSVYSDDKAMTLFKSQAGARDGLTVHFPGPLAEPTSKGTVVVPARVDRVVVRAHDRQHGFGGLEVVVELDEARNGGIVTSTNARESKIAALK